MMMACTVCGGRVHEYEHIRTIHDGERYRFCCDEHKEEFERFPEQFV